MAKPYVILAHYRTGSKMLQSMLGMSGVVDIFQEYGKPEYNLDNLCADIYYNHDLPVEERRTKPYFDIDATLALIKEGLEYYRDCANKNNLVAYSIRINHAIQKKVFDLVFPIIKKVIKHSTYIITTRNPLDIMYSVHRVKEKIEATGAKMNPDLSDDDVMTSFFSTYKPMIKLLKKYDTAFFVYPDGFKSLGNCSAKISLEDLGCNPRAVNEMFKKTKIVTMPRGYKTKDGESYKIKYRHKQNTYVERLAVLASMLKTNESRFAP